MVMVQSADGRIARHSSQISFEWNSREDKRYFRETTRNASLVIMGRKTYETISNPIFGPLNIVLTSTPSRFRSSPGQLEFMGGRPDQLLRNLEKRGFDKALLLGGASTNTAFLEAGLVDQINITQEGILFGQGPGICRQLSRDISLKIIDVEAISGSSILIKYKVLN